MARTRRRRREWNIVHLRRHTGLSGYTGTGVGTATVGFGSQDIIAGSKAASVSSLEQTADSLVGAKPIPANRACETAC